MTVTDAGGKAALNAPGPGVTIVVRLMFDGGLAA
jgi:hypothetical protein